MRLVDTTQVAEGANVAAVKPLAFQVADASTMMGISRSRLFLEIRGGRIASFKSGRRRLISQKAIDQWIKARDKAAAD